jgi:single-strand DNA-binding protein
MNTTNLRLPEQNNVTLVGRLTRDPETKFTGKGQAMCRFDIAVNRRYKGTDGSWKDDVSYVPVVVWGDAASRCGERLKKGSPVHVEGRLQSRSWETKDGQKRNSLEVIARRVQFLSKASDDSTPEKPDAPVSETAAAEAEEEIPF